MPTHEARWVSPAEREPWAQRLAAAVALPRAFG